MVIFRLSLRTDMDLIDSITVEILIVVAVFVVAAFGLAAWLPGEEEE